MQKNLQAIFDSITPENIKSLPVIKDSMDIFIEVLNEISSESVEIRTIFDNPNIKEELIQIYLNDIYNTLKNIDYNQDIINRVESINELANIEFYKIDAIKDISRFIKDEHFLTAKSYKQKKGTKESIKYLYEMINSFITTDSQLGSSFELVEISPFNFEVTGNMLKEIYDNIIRPLAHPLGFTYVYKQLIKTNFVDFFNVTFEYSNVELEIRCKSGYYFIFTDLLESAESEEAVKESFLKKVNPNTGEYYQLSDFETYVTIFYGYSVEEITRFEDSTIRKTTIEFKNKHTLTENFDKDLSKIVFELKEQNGGLIRDWGNSNNAVHCSLFLDYDLKYTNNTVDTIGFENNYKMQDYYGSNPCMYYIGSITVGNFTVCPGDENVLVDEFTSKISFGYDIESEQIVIGSFTVGDGSIIGSGTNNDLYPTAQIIDDLTITII